MKKEENGFILYSSLKIKESKPNDKCGPYYNGYWLTTKENEKYFLKIYKYNTIPNRFYVEVFLEQLAEIVGLPTVKSRIVEIQKNNIYGMMSVDYRKPEFSVVSGKDVVYQYLEYLEKTPFNSSDTNHKNLLEKRLGVKTITELGEKEIHINTLDLIWEALNYRYQDYTNKDVLVASIIDQLKGRYLFLFMTMQSDFHLGNWELLESDYVAHLTPMYDMEMGFREDFFDCEKNTTIRYSTQPITNIYDDFANFYFASDEGTKKSIDHIYRLLTPEILKESLEDINHVVSLNVPEQAKQKILKMYQEHYQNMGDILENIRTR